MWGSVRAVALPLALAFALVGCDRVFALTHVHETTPDAAPDAGPPPPLCLHDTFDASSVDRTAWRIYDETNMPVVLALQAGRLEITLSSTPSTSNGITSVGRYDLTGGSSEVALVEVPTGMNCEAGFDVARDALNYYLMAVGNGGLTLQVMKDGLKSNQTVPYNATNHRNLRVVHDMATDMIGFETSPDGATWTRQRTVPRLIDVSSMFVDVYAGTYFTGDPNPGRASFDEVRLVNAACPR